MRQRGDNARVPVREITPAEFETWNREDYALVDIRDVTVYNHGFIPNAISVPVDVEDIKNRNTGHPLQTETWKRLFTISKEISVVVYCQRGEESRYVAQKLTELGYQAYNLTGGYLEWLIHNTREVDMERYSRHLLLENVGLAGQKKLLHSKVLIVGAGGLGAPAALYLAAAGVGTLGIVDDDKVELSNLQRQIIHTTQNIGKEKVSSAKEMLNRINPDVSVVCYPERVTPENVMEIISGYDFIIDGVDNFPTKFMINDACVIAEKPFCHGGILQFQGQFMTYVPQKGPCYRCIFEDIPEEGSIPSCREAGVLGVMAGIIGSLQGLEALKYLLGIGELMTGRMLVFNGLSMKFREVPFRHPSPSCRVCGQYADIQDVREHAQEYGRAAECILADDHGFADNGQYL